MLQELECVRLRRVGAECILPVDVELVECLLACSCALQRCGRRMRFAHQGVLGCLGLHQQVLQGLSGCVLDGDRLRGGTQRRQRVRFRDIPLNIQLRREEADHLDPALQDPFRWQLAARTIEAEPRDQFRPRNRLLELAADHGLVTAVHPVKVAAAVIVRLRRGAFRVPQPQHQRPVKELRFKVDDDALALLLVAVVDRQYAALRTGVRELSPRCLAGWLVPMIHQGVRPRLLEGSRLPKVLR
mmetsp:Transcript_15567/g.43684  ORF Transcript_15567/g.43684 Transcript_15567/m.43684 type:complete len:243 (-) Transcript_15567:1732-2460(-)